MTDTPRFSTWEQAVQWLRSDPDQRDLVMAAYYDDPLLAAAERYWNSEEWDAIRPLLGVERTHALDVGAGRGIASYALGREGFRVTALEPDGSAIVGAQAIRALARDSGLPIEVSQEFSERLPFADGQFDVVFARAVLHHTRDLRSACAEFFRVLKPGGRLVAVREHVISHAQDIDAFLRIHPLHHLYGGENAFQKTTYEAAILAAGFQLEQVLGPLESPVNHAPHTRQSLQQEVAARATRNLPVLRELARLFLRLPGIWSLAVPLLARVDHRPGRLYSFIATRPR